MKMDVQSYPIPKGPKCLYLAMGLDFIDPIPEKGDFKGGLRD